MEELRVKKMFSNYDSGNNFISTLQNPLEIE